jgi:hypothetical protein
VTNVRLCTVFTKPTIFSRSFNCKHAMDKLIQNKRHVFLTDCYFMSNKPNWFTKFWCTNIRLSGTQSGLYANISKCKSCKIQFLRKPGGTETGWDTPVSGQRWCCKPIRMNRKYRKGKQRALIDASKSGYKHREAVYWYPSPECRARSQHKYREYILWKCGTVQTFGNGSNK